jgi:hypothetical protein
MTAIVVGSLLAGIGLFIAVVHSKSKGSAQRRSDGVRHAAERLGWRYREEIDFKSLPDLSRFELFRTGTSRKLSNLVTSPPGLEPRAVLFDYAYTVSTGKSSSTIRQTVLYLTDHALHLPSFSLRPENFFHRVGQMFGYQDIDLDQHPEFSRAYLLRGEQEARVRQAFTGAVADFFERRSGSCAAGLGRELLFWRPGRLIEPGELDGLIQDGQELAQRFGRARQQ